MTDAEIIKALECCNNGWCDGRCPYYGREDIADCREQSGADQLDLINRLNIENRKLRFHVARLKKYDEERDIRLHARLTETAKAEAIKEFAERVKRYIDVGHLRPPTEICFSELDVVSMIDNLVKEMVGDTG